MQQSSVWIPEAAVGSHFLYFCLNIFERVVLFFLCWGRECVFYFLAADPNIFGGRALSTTKTLVAALGLPGCLIRHIPR